MIQWLDKVEGRLIVSKEKWISDSEILFEYHLQSHFPLDGSQSENGRVNIRFPIFLSRFNHVLLVVSMRFCICNYGRLTWNHVVADLRVLQFAYRVFQHVFFVKKWNALLHRFQPFQPRYLGTSRLFFFFLCINRSGNLPTFGNLLNLG